MSRFVQADRDQPFLLPPDLRDWLPADDMAHLIIEAVDRVDIGQFKVNTRGTGSEQYHPHLMLSLLIYCYAHGIFSSRKIERACYRDIAVRFIAANRQPDHDTICKFRRENEGAIGAAFEQVLLMARELGVLKVGLVSVDGSKINANASRHRSVRYDRIQALREQLRKDIGELLEQAEAADRQDADDGETLPADLARREALLAKLDAAAARLEEDSDDEDPPGSGGVRPDRQINLTDEDSSLMRKNGRSEYQQAYNAQAAVDAEGSQLIVGARVSTCGSDRHELVATVEAMDEMPERVLADNGYAQEQQVRSLQERGVDVLVATEFETRRRRYDFRPERDKRVRQPRAAWLREMVDKLTSEQGRKLYRKRQQTVEPVFGIIKSAMGFRQFLLRGLRKTSLEWQLVALAYNCKRLNNLKIAANA